MPLACLTAVSTLMWELRSRLGLATSPPGEGLGPAGPGGGEPPVVDDPARLRREMHECCRRLLAAALAVEGFVYVDEQGHARVLGRRRRPELVVVVDPLCRADGAGGIGSPSGSPSGDASPPASLTQVVAYSRHEAMPLAAVVGDLAEDVLYAGVLHPFEARHAVRCDRHGTVGLLDLARHGPVAERLSVAGSEPGVVRRLLPVAVQRSRAPVGRPSSLTLCQVAAGRLDAFLDLDGRDGQVHRELLPGRVVLEAAGGQVAGLDGHRLPWPEPPALPGASGGGDVPGIPDRLDAPGGDDPTPGDPATGDRTTGAPRTAGAQPFVAGSWRAAGIVAGCLAHGSPDVPGRADRPRYPLVPANLWLPLRGRPVSETLARAIRRQRLVPRREPAIAPGDVTVRSQDLLLPQVAAWVREHRDAWLDQPLCPDGAWPDGLTVEEVEPDPRLARWLARTGLDRDLHRLGKLPMSDYLKARCGGVESLVRFGRAFDRITAPRHPGEGEARAVAPAPGPWRPGDGYDAEFVARHDALVADCLEPRLAAVLRARTAIGRPTAQALTYEQIARFLVHEGIDPRPVTPGRIAELMWSADRQVGFVPFDSPDHDWLRARLRATAWGAEPAAALARYATEGLRAAPRTAVPHLLRLMGVTLDYEDFLTRRLRIHLSRKPAAGRR